MAEDKTQVVAGPFVLRRKARRFERGVQAGLDNMREANVASSLNEDGEFRAPWGLLLRRGDPSLAQMPMLPGWTQGVRVERAGRFQFVVVATSQRGH